MRLLSVKYPGIPLLYIGEELMRKEAGGSLRFGVEVDLIEPTKWPRPGLVLQAWLTTHSKNSQDIIHLRVGPPMEVTWPATQEADGSYAVDVKLVGEAEDPDSLLDNIAPKRDLEAAILVGRVDLVSSDAAVEHIPWSP